MKNMNQAGRGVSIVLVHELREEHTEILNVLYQIEINLRSS